MQHQSYLFTFLEKPWARVNSVKVKSISRLPFYHNIARRLQGILGDNYR